MITLFDDEKDWRRNFTESGQSRIQKFWRGGAEDNVSASSSCT